MLQDDEEYLRTEGQDQAGRGQKWVGGEAEQSRRAGSGQVRSRSGVDNISIMFAGPPTPSYTHASPPPLGP